MGCTKNVSRALGIGRTQPYDRIIFISEEGSAEFRFWGPGANNLVGGLAQLLIAAQRCAFPGGRKGVMRERHQDVACSGMLILNALGKSPFAFED